VTGTHDQGRSLGCEQTGSRKRGNVTLGAYLVFMNTKLYALVSLPLVALAVFGCSSSTDTTRMWIGPELVECEGVAPQMCMQVAYAEDEEYQYFYDQIAGFDYQEGTSYVIDVEITEVADPPADASSLIYTLVEIIEED